MNGASETLGESIPRLPHAISVSLPTWRDNVGYEEVEKRVVDAMVNGYPRFFIHQSIAFLSFSSTGTTCFLANNSLYKTGTVVI